MKPAFSVAAWLGFAATGFSFASPPPQQSVAAAQRTTQTRDTQSDTWTATDALGRTLPGHAECGPPRPGKFVGIFYFLWLDKRHDTGLWDISKLLAAHPNDPQYGPLQAFHCGANRAWATTAWTTRSCFANTPRCFPTPAWT
jgi:hypothetical protein